MERYVFGSGCQECVEPLISRASRLIGDEGSHVGVFIADTPKEFETPGEPISIHWFCPDSFSDFRETELRSHCHLLVPV
ncbi:hypothetical protein MUG78_16850 [Gordonia alkaliphila]|uniref:hypothetical protein n=1 Tax=Gordonia alkaliphila TaxID=1053547 RepID=UPI001FF5F421|nr:hypothetical protein [Gordonia alkaliphila]MCK0441070.1 hypothetical protein [Gordonia alkaliphila]